MKIESYRKPLYFLLAIVLLGSAFFVAKKNANQLAQNTNTDTVSNEQKQDIIAGTEQISKDTTDNSNPLSYKELLAIGQKFYLEARYPEALSAFTKATELEESAGIYRSIFSVYVKMKDYPNAQRAMEKSISLDPGMASGWVEYVSFENYYVKASFETISKIYLDGLKATKDNIDLITGYASYLEESKKYDEAIEYFKKAITVDPARKDLFQAEINRLQAM